MDVLPDIWENRPLEPLGRLALLASKVACRNSSSTYIHLCQWCVCLLIQVLAVCCHWSYCQDMGMYVVVCVSVPPTKFRDLDSGLH